MKKFLFMMLFLLWIVPVQAQLTISECVKTALANNPGLKITESETKIVMEDVRQAWSSFLPSLNLSGSYRRQSVVPELDLSSIKMPIGGQEISIFQNGAFQLGMLDNYDFKLTLSQPIFTGFKLSNRWKAAKSIATSKSEDLMKNRSDLIYKVETAYGNVLKALKFLQIAQSAKQQVLAHLKDVENFVSQGMAKKDERLKVQVKLSEAELTIIQAENAIKMAKVALENLIGQTLPSDVNLAPMEVQDVVSPEVLTSIQRAYSERAELRTFKYAKEAGQASIKIAWGDMYPSLAAFGTLGYGKPGLDFIKREWMDYWLVGISAEWNLWSWGKTKSQVQQAKLKVNAIIEAERQVRDAIEMDVTQACLFLEETDKRLQLTTVMEDQAAESFRVTENSYKQGLATHTDFFDTQSELTRAQLQKARSEIDAALAKANWRRAIGTNVKSYNKNIASPIY
jgi:outer membrane protein